MNKKLFWLIFFIFFLILIIFSLCTRHDKSCFLTIESAEGEFYELTFQEVDSRKGINFDKIDQSNELSYNVNVEHNIEVLKQFYKNYYYDKGNSIIKVLFLDQILALTSPANLYYEMLIFESIDGAKVVIEPTQYDDNLILITIEKSKNNYTLRLIMPEDRFQQRWLKNLCKISIKNTKD